MASPDDLDLIRLFGLSAEEAGGLGLAPSTQAPRAALGDRRGSRSQASLGRRCRRRPGWLYGGIEAQAAGFLSAEAEKAD